MILLLVAFLGNSLEYKNNVSFSFTEVLYSELQVTKPDQFIPVNIGLRLPLIKDPNYGSLPPKEKVKVIKRVTNKQYKIFLESVKQYQKQGLVRNIERLGGWISPSVEMEVKPAGLLLIAGNSKGGASLSERKSGLPEVAPTPPPLPQKARWLLFQYSKKEVGIKLLGLLKKNDLFKVVHKEEKQMVVYLNRPLEVNDLQFLENFNKKVSVLYSRF